LGSGIEELAEQTLSEISKMTTGTGDKPFWTVRTTALEQARILAGLSYQQLALRARVDRATLSDFLNGRRHPTLGTVHRILKCLDLDPKDIFSFQEPESS